MPGREALIGLGSNLGDREQHLRRAVEGLALVGEVTAVSSVYESAPVGVDPTQPPYLNAVVAIETLLSPRQLLAHLHELEAAAGRERGTPGAARTLDLDLLLVGDEVGTDDDLILPHPRMAERRFVLEPLAEIRPDAVLPDGTRVASLLEAVAGQDVKPLGPGWMPAGPPPALDRAAVRTLRTRHIAGKRKRPGCLGVLVAVVGLIAAACSSTASTTTVETSSTTSTVAPVTAPPLLGPGATDPIAAIFFALPALPDCGFEELRTTDDMESGHNAGARSCLIDAVETGAEAAFTSTRLTINDDPVVSHYRAHDGVLEIFVDGTADPLGEPRWYGFTCSGVDVFGPDLVLFTPLECSDYVP